MSETAEEPQIEASTSAELTAVDDGPPGTPVTPTPSLHAAMVQAFAEIKPIDRNSEGMIGRRTYNYATLAEIHSHTQPILASCGLAVLQTAIEREVNGTTFVGCETEIIHTSGEFRKTEFVIPVAGPTAQSMGSAVTYAKRYSFPFFIQADESDDDGAAASNSGGNSGGGHNGTGPPSDDDLPRAGTRSRSGPPNDGPSPVDQSDQTEALIQRPQAISLTGLATRRASEFDSVSGKEILDDIAKSKGLGNWEAMWPRIKMRQLHDVSKVIQEWEPPTTGE